MNIYRLLRTRLRQFLRPPALPNNADGSINLHLGCGPVNHPEFINVDLADFHHIHYRLPIDRLDRFADDSVDLVYACHCLEHFPHERIVAVLKEWRRVLKPGGTLRLSVPDFDAVSSYYREGMIDLAKLNGFLMGAQDYPLNFHYVLFNRPFLTELLAEAGFKGVALWQPGSGPRTTFDDWSGRLMGGKYPVSLNLQANK